MRSSSLPRRLRAAGATIINTHRLTRRASRRSRPCAARPLHGVHEKADGSGGHPAHTPPTGSNTPEVAEEVWWTLADMWSMARSHAAMPISSPSSAASRTRSHHVIACQSGQLSGPYLCAKSLPVCVKTRALPMKPKLRVIPPMRSNPSLGGRPCGLSAAITAQSAPQGHRSDRASEIGAS